MPEKKQPHSPPNAFEEAGEEKPLSLMQELFVMVSESKKWWLLPILVCLALVGLLTVLGATGAGPFLYTLF